MLRRNSVRYDPSWPVIPVINATLRGGGVVSPFVVDGAGVFDDESAIVVREMRDCDCDD